MHIAVSFMMNAIDSATFIQLARYSNRICCLNIIYEHAQYAEETEKCDKVRRRKLRPELFPLKWFSMSRCWKIVTYNISDLIIIECSQTAPGTWRWYFVVFFVRFIDSNGIVVFWSVFYFCLTLHRFQEKANITPTKPSTIYIFGSMRCSYNQQTIGWASHIYWPNKIVSDCYCSI